MFNQNNTPTTTSPAPRRRPILKFLVIIILIILAVALFARIRDRRQGSAVNPENQTAALQSGGYFSKIIDIVLNRRDQTSTPSPAPTGTTIPVPTENYPVDPYEIPAPNISIQAGFSTGEFTYTNKAGKSVKRTVSFWYPTQSPAIKYSYSSGPTGEVANGAKVSDGKWPLVVFSHGYKGCDTQSVFITEQLARRGYIVAAPVHSDASCSTGGAGEAPGFRDAVSWTDQKYLDRKEDMSALIDYMLSQNTNSNSQFYGKIDSNSIAGMGHSLGGYTILGMVGGWSSWNDSRIKAALLLSPYSEPFLDTDGSLSKIKVPVMMQGGTLDISITPGLTKIYNKIPNNKYFLVLPRATHFAWTNTSCRNTTSVSCIQTGNPSLILSYGTAFLDYSVKKVNTAANTLHTKNTSLSSYIYKD